MRKHSVLTKAALCITLLGLTVLLLGLLLNLLKKSASDSGRELTKTLEVRVSSLAVDYAPAAMLFDDAVRKQLEDELGVRLQIVVVSESRNDNPDLSPIFGNAFSGVAFIVDPLLLVQASDMKALYEVTFFDRQRQFFRIMRSEQMAGRYKGHQYGYAFASEKSEGHALYVNREILEQAGIFDLAVTPEAFHAALVRLKAEGITPLAVYGSPADEGFSILLDLFELKDVRSTDFMLENGRVVYDKTTARAKEYLEYVAELYREQLIPQDFLSLNEYSAALMLADGKCAMSVLTDRHCRDLVDAQSRDKGMQICEAATSASFSDSPIRCYERLTGVISARVHDPETAMQFFDLLATLAEQEQNGQEKTTQELYPLFKKSRMVEERLDPVSKCRYNIRLLNEKRILDQSWIHPVFKKVVLGELPASAFDQACSDWNTAGGRILCELYTHYYNNMLKGVGVT